MNTNTLLPYVFGRGNVDGRASTGLLVLRVLAGTAMAIHGSTKMMTPFTWMGPSASMPGALQFLGAFAEFGGGIAWILGLLTPIATAGILFTMVMGILTWHIPMHEPFIRLTVGMATPGPGEPWGIYPTWLARAGGQSIAGSGSSELASLFIAMSAVLLGIGPGRFSLDALLARRFGRDAAQRDLLPHYAHQRGAS
ncbi:DoxX family protein [Pendulispora albinea]|uniref:DoxX family protein n=1 Tax=Pendulispora albinea TaxID=2741071 RepID=A0ABZ2M4P9_9BACT